jgi:hypothetical protein
MDENKSEKKIYKKNIKKIRSNLKKIRLLAII